MTIGGSIALIIVGAILRFGVTWEAKYLDLKAIGVILMLAGLAGLLISVAFIVSRRRGRAPAPIYEEPRYTEPPS